MMSLPHLVRDALPLHLMPIVRVLVGRAIIAVVHVVRRPGLMLDCSRAVIFSIVRIGVGRPAIGVIGLRVSVIVSVAVGGGIFIVGVVSAPEGCSCCGQAQVNRTTDDIRAERYRAWTVIVRIVTIRSSIIFRCVRCSIGGPIRCNDDSLGRCAACECATGCEKCRDGGAFQQIRILHWRSPFLDPRRFSNDHSVAMLRSLVMPRNFCARR